MMANSFPRIGRWYRSRSHQDGQAKRDLGTDNLDCPDKLQNRRPRQANRLPAQDAYSAARQRYFDEEMTFRPANSLLAHRPLGSVMRARLQVYRALAAFRQHENGVTPARQADIAEVPA